MGKTRVCVLGAGVVGLTTASLLLDRRPDIEVTVVADRFTVDTVSDGAAGIFRPSSTNFRGPDEDTTRRWVEDSYHYYCDLLSSPRAEAAGVKEVSVVYLSTEHESIVRGSWQCRAMLWDGEHYNGPELMPFKNSFLEAILPEYHFLTAEELKAHPGGPYRYGCRFRTLLVENRRYMPYLTESIRARGGRVVQQHLSSLEELAGQYDAVVNCTGLGARSLCGDTALFPIRGQVMKVRAPWIKQSYYVDFDTYIIPGFDLVTLGGCRQFDSWNTSNDRHDSNSIWERCLAVLPTLKNAEIVREWTGLRPYRHVVRVEPQLLPLSSGLYLKVVHNYGHGGYGVTSAPGTSMAAVRQLLHLLGETESSPRAVTAKL